MTAWNCEKTAHTACVRSSWAIYTVYKLVSQYMPHSALTKVDAINDSAGLSILHTPAARIINITPLILPPGFNVEDANNGIAAATAVLAMSGIIVSSR
jgi:hypothetical protein